MGQPCYIGIDPGITGAVAIITSAGEVVSLTDIPVMASSEVGSRRVRYHINPSALFSIVRPYTIGATAIIERTSAMPGQGAASMYSMGDSFGVCRAACAFAALRIEPVSPRAWKRKLGLGKDKEQARAMAIARFPSVADLLSRKKDHNRAEALLLAEYGRRFL